MRNSNRPFIIAIASLSIVAVCCVGVAVGFGLGLFDGPGAAAKPAATQSATSSVAAASSASAASSSSKSAAKSDAAAEKSAASESKSSAAVSSSEASKAATPKTVTTTTQVTAIDLSNSTDYYDVNLFLSNFAEWPEFYRNGQSFDRDDQNLRQLVNWAMWHNAINDAATLDTKSAEVPGAPASEASKSIESIKDSTYLRNMNTELIENTIERFIGLKVDLHGYNSGDGAYYEHDGKLYEGLYRGDAAPRDNVALADKVKGMGNNIVRVDFTIYSGNSSVNVVSDKSWYGMTGKQLESAMRSAGSNNVTTQPATAFIEVVNTKDGRTFKLVSFELVDYQMKSW